MAGGRPTKYSDEVLTKTRDYIDNFGNYGDLVPSIEGLASELGLGARTLHDWKHQEDKQEFSRMLGELLSKQARIAMNGALGGDYNATIAKLLLTKHGYSDKVDQTSESTHTIKAPDLKVQFVDASADTDSV